MMGVTTVLTRDPDAPRTYVAVNEETGVIERSVYLGIGAFTDLGEPATVTVTVEPGDAPNARGGRVDAPARMLVGEGGCEFPARFLPRRS